MRESLRQAYNSFYSQRESKSVSPTTGRVHKQRESFGPTVCLINKNPQSQIDINNDKAYLLMLILQIERLNKIIASLQSADQDQLSNTQRGQLDFLRKQVLNLKTALQRSDNQKYEQIQRQNKMLYANSNKLNQYETHINISNRRIKEFEQTKNELLNKINNLQEQLGRAKTEAAKANMNLFMSSQTELQKSAIRDKSSAMEMEIWKQKLGKYQHMINQQKQFINQQKRTIDRLQNTQLEIRQKYDYDMSMLRKSNQQLQQKYNKLERQLSNKVLNTSAQASRQLSSKLRQMDSLRQKVEELGRQNMELKKNMETISRNKNQSVEQMRAVIGQLRQSLEQLNNDYGQQTQKYERMKAQNINLKKQNQNAKNELQRIHKNHSSEMKNLQDELSNREVEIKNIRKQRKRNEIAGKPHKSYSESNFRTSTSLKSSTADLSGIIRDMMDLQDSNSRMNRLIQTTSRSQAVHNKFYSYSSYGL